MSRQLSILLLFISFWSHQAYTQLTVFEGDHDLETYVSRPDIRSPKFVVDTVDKNSVTKGYLFVAPYGDLLNRPPTRLHESLQIGPHIYDENGELIWSGAGLFPGRNAFDFKVTETEAGSQLTFILTQNEHQDEYVSGAGIVLDNTYEFQKDITATRGSRLANMHEFSLAEGGRTALLFVHQLRLFESFVPRYHGWTMDLGFVEIDVQTRETLFEWWSLDHVHPLESTVGRPPKQDNPNYAWDYFHINSVDKDSDGNYLVSARHANAIYKIDGVSGKIIWQLGGKRSSFEQDFVFSSQHHARFRGSDGEKSTISFMNNGADGHKGTNTSAFSSAMIVELDTSTMTATLARKYDRPDGGSTELRGNVQVLPSTNVLVGWSENSYLSEFTADGRLVMEAHFQSHRFATYRSFKFNFTANPSEDPALVCKAYGLSSSSALTACYVSWNGATEARAWRFWSVKDGNMTLVGTKAKTRFETELMISGYHEVLFAEAMDADGRSLRKSPVFHVKSPFLSGSDLDDHIDYQNIGSPHDSVYSAASIDLDTSDPEANLPPNSFTLHRFNMVFGASADGSSLAQVSLGAVVGATGMLLAMQAPAIYRLFAARRRVPWEEKGPALLP